MATVRELLVVFGVRADTRKLQGLSNIIGNLKKSFLSSALAATQLFLALRTIQKNAGQAKNSIAAFAKTGLGIIGVANAARRLWRNMRGVSAQAPGIRAAAQATSTLAQQAGSVSNLGNSLKFALGGFLGIFGVLRLGRRIGGTIKEFESLEAQLVTVEQSAERGAEQFRRMEQFAKTTPFEIKNLTAGFARLRAIGLGPTDKEMTALGDLAASFGASFEDLAVGIQGASTGITTSLRRFGITARVEGDKMKLSFKDQTVTVNRDAESIQKALVGLSEQNFAGGMERQMNTLGGALSNLTDTFDVLFATMGRAGLGKELVLLVKDIDQAGSSAQKLARTLGKTLSGAVRFLRTAMDFLGDNIRIITAALVAFAAVKVLGMIAALQAAIAGLTIRMIAMKAVALLLPAAILATFLLLEDLVAFAQGRPSVLGDLLKTDPANPFLRTLAVIGQFIDFVLVEGFGKIPEGFRTAIAELKNLALSIKAFFRNIINSILEFFGDIPAGLAKLVRKHPLVKAAFAGAKLIQGDTKGARSEIVGAARNTLPGAVASGATSVANKAVNFARAGVGIDDSVRKTEVKVGDTTITVNVPPGMDPEQAARMVKDQIDKTKRKDFENAAAVFEGASG